jgi:fumarate reductase subunit C
MIELMTRGATPSGPGRATHPKAYQRKMPLLWWKGNPRYTLYMLREASAITSAIWTLMFLRQVGQLRKGPAAYHRFVRGMRSPVVLLFNLVNLGLALLHSYTWLKLTAEVMPLPPGVPRPKPQQLRIGLFATWAVISFLIALPFFFGGLRGKGRNNG